MVGRVIEEFGDPDTMPRHPLITLLGTQPVEREPAIEAIDHALTTGKGIAEAVAHLDGQL